MVEKWKIKMRVTDDAQKGRVKRNKNMYDNHRGVISNDK